MTSFSQSLSINASGIIGSGHPPIVHSWLIPDGFTATAGQVLVNTAGTVALWDGSDPVAVTIDETSGDASVSSGVLAVAVSDTLTGDGSVSVLVHGCYLYSRVTVGSATPTVAQVTLLSGAGLFAENAW